MAERGSVGVSVAVEAGPVAGNALVTPSFSSSFSSEAIGQAPAFPQAPVSPVAPMPGFAAVSAETDVSYGVDAVRGINPLSDPGWVGYSPQIDEAAMPDGNLVGISEEGVGSRQRVQVVFPSAQSIAEYLGNFARPVVSQREAPGVLEAAEATGSEHSSDEAIAQNVRALAEELGLPDVAKQAEAVLETTQQVQEGEEGITNVQQVTDEASNISVDGASEVLRPVTQEADAAVDSKAEKARSEETATEAEESADDADSQEALQEAVLPEDKVEDKMPQDQEQQPQDIRAPRVAADVDGQRASLLEALAGQEEQKAKEQGREMSAEAVAEEFDKTAPLSPIRGQLGLNGDEEGIHVIKKVVSEVTSPSAAGVVVAGRQSIATNSAVVLAPFGQEATKLAVQRAVGSSIVGLRRNPFPQAA